MKPRTIAASIAAEIQMAVFLRNGFPRIKKGIFRIAHFRGFADEETFKIQIEDKTYEISVREIK